MTAPVEHVLISKTLLWAMMVTVLGTVALGGYTAGQFSERLVNVESQVKSFDTIKVQVAGISSAVEVIKDQLTFLAGNKNIMHGSSSDPSSPVYGDRQ